MSERMTRRRLAALALAVTLAGCGSDAPIDDVIRVDLADIVGGGDGNGTGTTSGIDVLTGAATTVQGSAIACPANVFVAAESTFVDGVFCADGGEAEDEEIAVSTTGVTVTGVPDWTPIAFPQTTWDNLWNGPNTGVVTEAPGALIGAHCNKGITFDLLAIQAAYGDTPPSRFTAVAGIGSREPFEENVLSFLVFVDGEQRYVRRMEMAPDSAFDVSVPLRVDDRFLTLITASTGDIQGDWAYWGDPVVEIPQ